MRRNKETEILIAIIIFVSLFIGLGVYIGYNAGYKQSRQDAKVEFFMIIEKKAAEAIKRHEHGQDTSK